MSNLPPIVFEPRAGKTWRDPFPMYKALRDRDPIHMFESKLGEFWILSRFKHVFNAAADAQTFTSAQGLTMLYGEMDHLEIESPIVMMDPPDHTALRKVAIKRFTPKQVMAIEPLIRRQVALSYGPHHCIGAAAVRVQARVAFAELTARCPDFALDYESGTFAGSNYVRRYMSMPFRATGAL